MDLLFKKYASPFSLLDCIIQASQFDEWVSFFINKQAEQKNDDTMWEFYLHKVYEKSFDEWKSEVTNQTPTNSSGTVGTMDEAKKKEIIQKSEDILNGFNPSTP